MGKMGAPGATSFGTTASPAVDKREQRKRDQARGLVPFAVKLNSDLVKRLHDLANDRGLDLNTVVADVLNKGLDAK